MVTIPLINIPTERQAIINPPNPLDKEEEWYRYWKAGAVADRDWYRYWKAVADAVRALQAATVPLSYTVATMPTTADVGTMIYVTNESGGAVPAFWDGTNWRRVTDRAIVT